jgi:hypothetical protein
MITQFLMKYLVRILSTPGPALSEVDFPPRAPCWIYTRIQYSNESFLLDTGTLKSASYVRGLVWLTLFTDSTWICTNSNKVKIHTHTLGARTQVLSPSHCLWQTTRKVCVVGTQYVHYYWLQKRKCTLCCVHLCRRHYERSLLGLKSQGRLPQAPQPLIYQQSRLHNRGGVDHKRGHLGSHQPPPIIPGFIQTAHDTDIEFRF